MIFPGWRKNIWSYWLFCVGLLFSFSLSGSSATFAQNDPAFVRHVRALESDEMGLSNPAGLAFSPGANAFHVVEAPGRGRPPPADTDIITLTPFADRVGSARIAAAIKDPINTTYDTTVNRLLIFQSAPNKLIEVLEGADGSLDPSTLIRHEARHFGLQNPQGMTVDPLSGHLFILDSSGPRLIRVEPEPAGGFDNAVISAVDLQPTGLVDPRGLAFDPTSGHLHVVNPAEQTLVELTQTGQVVATRDLSEFDLGDPQGMTFAPSGDLTDDPPQMSLYLADRGRDAGGPGQGAGSSQAGQMETQASAVTQRPGQIVELSFVEAPAAAASSFTSALVRTTDLAAISPPSPDPSGLTYLPNSNTLLICDGEVEETVQGITHFQGANVWELTLSGGVVRTANISKVAPTVVPMTDEPTGVTWNPANGHFFFTDDGTKEVYDLNPGADGLVGTQDDSWTHFDTLAVGNGDPEGITFDTWNNRLFVADGVNREVYEYTLSGSLVSHFDVLAYGVEDPESVEFNPDSGTLFIMSSKRTGPVIVETTTNGALLQTIDFSAANSSKAAGLAYAPASDGSGTKRFYIVDRGIDNNSDPNIIDGKMYEMTVPPGASVNTPTATNTPTSTPTPAGSPTFTSTPTNTPLATDTPTATNTPTPTNTPTASDLIFADGFESGNLSAWSASSTDGGDLSVSAAAALVGSNGLQAVLDDNVAIYLTDETPTAEPRYRARFYFDPNSILMASGDNHFIFRGYSGTSTLVLRVQFRFRNGNYHLRAALRNDASTWTNTGWFTLSDAPHAIELDWRAATAAGANDGGLTLWIDGAQQANLTGVDNDTRRIDRVRLGAVAGIDTGTRGTYYFDAFESRRQTYIGPVSSGTSMATPTPEGSPTFTPTPGGTLTLEVRVSASSDDAEERATGRVGLASSDLELVFDKDIQTVGMRFNEVNIPQGATIANAYVQFQVDEVTTEATSLTIQGEVVDNAATFTTVKKSISSRPRTTAAVSWSPAPWTTKGQAGPDQQTPNIAPVVEEIVSRPGWTSGNPLVVIITGSGKRTAESFDGDQAGAPLLHAEFVVN